MSNATYLLFIAGIKNPKSINALKNIKQGFKDKDFDLMVIDILENPSVAESARIIATPLLMRTKPNPIKRFVGDFSNFKREFFI